MAAPKKYAGLPDLDDAGTELYQTPGLTDDASTVQTDTLRTESPTPSENANENFDRTRVDREEARRRFEPAMVGARDVNFSYAVGGNQKSYTSRHRRRRRVRRSNGVTEYGDISEESDAELEETLGQKLARLRREAEEVRLEIERQEKEDGEFQDTYEHQQGEVNHEENDVELWKEMDEVSQILNGLQPSAKRRHETLEQEFSRRLDAESLTRKPPVHSIGKASKDIGLSSSTINAITTFSDRLSSIESALGLSTLSPAPSLTAVLPTLEALTNQVDLLHSTISPKPTPSSTTTTTTNANTTLTSQMPHLDILQTRLHTLHQSATSLLTVRKAAQTALTDLETVRLRGIRAADHLARYQNLANRRANRTNTITSPTGRGPHDNEDDIDGNNVTRPTSRGGPGRRRGTITEEARERLEIGDEIITPLFLEEQAEKIKALYNILPTIQDLQPLLPVVLERLRGLSVVHAGAADARRDMDELEGRLREWEGEVERWKEAVEGIESGITEAEGAMKGNVKVIGEMVSGVEDRVRRLEES